MQTNNANRVLTISEAVEATRTSKSTIKRAIANGLLPNAKKVDGIRHAGSVEWRIPVSDLEEAGFEPFMIGPRGRRTGFSKSYSADILRTLDAVCRHAHGQHGVLIIPTEGVVAKKASKGRELRKPNRLRPRMFTLQETAAIASHLHLRYQLAVWLGRIIGLRVGEIYGIHIDDIQDFGDVGLLEVHAQGGEWRFDRDELGDIILVDEKEVTKTEAGWQYIAIPGPLLELIRCYVDYFHRDPATGEVAGNPRLMVSTNKKDVGGIAAYREAYDKARRKVGLSNDLLGFQASTHHLRKSFAAEAKKRLGLVEHLRSQILGHRLRAHDGGSELTATTYTVDDPEIGPLLKFARKRAKYIVKSIGDLFVEQESTRPEGMVSISDIVKLTGLSKSAVVRWLHRQPGTEVQWIAENGSTLRLLPVEVVERIRSEYFDLYTIEKSPEDLNISVPVARSWIKFGQLSATKDDARRIWIVDRASVDALIPERRGSLHSRAGR